VDSVALVSARSCRVGRPVPYSQAPGAQIETRGERGQVEEAADVIEMEVRQDDVDVLDAVEEPALGDEPARAGPGVEDEPRGRRPE
jgi:hypothetical protein